MSVGIDATSVLDYFSTTYKIRIYPVTLLDVVIVSLLHRIKYNITSAWEGGIPTGDLT